MNKNLAKAFAGLCAINLVACSQSGGGSSGGQNSNPPAPITTSAEQLKIVMAG